MGLSLAEFDFNMNDISDNLGLIIKLLIVLSSKPDWRVNHRIWRKNFNGSGAGTGPGHPVRKAGGQNLHQGEWYLNKMKWVVDDLAKKVEQLLHLGSK